ncbi:MAG: DUF255 domain-containing protein [Bacteroidetes bacterium]|nr:DUF255 domain-containing protein [Bacteroidota bacterium]
MTNSNELSRETSPYLLQHANNPVQWHAWNTENLKIARELGKPLLISIGYSACHWCHVMEHESFEDLEVAEILNQNFYCIKVDREERPDVDQLYMAAVQIITRRGGWPLNCFAFPDGRPFHGGTYFRKDDFIRVLNAITREFTGNREKLEDFARRLSSAIRSNDDLPAAVSVNTLPQEFLNKVDEAIIQWSPSFDLRDGGMSGAPKFPMPNNLSFLLRYGFKRENQAVLDFVRTSLIRMACGGIYDQLEGGFARYSVDALWKVPHFEKMLYDNGQLLSLYSDAFLVFKDEVFRDVVRQTAEFLVQQYQDKSGNFFSAYDADSEGEEGKYYVWKPEELESILSDDELRLAKLYFRLGDESLWEHGNYVLQRNPEFGPITPEVNALLTKLSRIRKNRIPPALDDKTITSWNAMALSGLISASRILGNRSLDVSINNSLDFILQNQIRFENNRPLLWRTYKNGESRIEAFLEDYAFLIDALISSYEWNFNEERLRMARDLAHSVVALFYDGSRGMFTTSQLDSTDLVHNGIEYFDNVIPSANSVMCRNLIKLDKYFDLPHFRNSADEMLRKIAPGIAQYASGYSNWMHAIFDQYDSGTELVVTGANAINAAKDFRKYYLPDVVLAASNSSSEIPLLKDRTGDSLQFYLCTNRACGLPLTDKTEVLNSLLNTA